MMSTERALPPPDLSDLGGPLFAEAADPLFLLDPSSGAVVDANPEAQRLTGFGRDDLLRLPLVAIFGRRGPDGLARLFAALRESRPLRAAAGYRLRAAGGPGRAVTLTLSPLTGPRPLALLAARVVRRPRATVRLRRRDTAWRRLLGSVADCVWSATVEADGRWHYHYLSPVVERIAGRPAAHFRGDRGRWLDVVHPDDRSRVLAGDRTLLHGQRNAHRAQYLYRVLRPDGGVRWVLESVEVTPLSGGRVRLDGVLADVTDRHELEQSVRASEERLRRIVESNPNAVLLLDADGRIEFANHAAGQLFGLPRGKLLRLAWSDLAWEKHTPPAGSVRRAQERVLGRPDGTRAVVACSLVRLRDAHGRRAGMVASFTDVTERRRAEERLRASEERYRLLFRRNLAGVSRSRPDGVILECNDAFARILGYASAEELQGKEITPLYADPADRATFLERLRARGSLTNCEGRFRHKDGRTVWVIGNVTWTNGPDGPVIESTLIDVTERRGLEEQLRQAQKLEAVGQLAGGVAHDFNNLLTAVLGNLSLAQSLLPEGHSAHELLAEAELAGGRAADLTRQLLGFARRQPMKLTPVDLNAAVEETARLLRRTIDPRIRLELDLAADLNPALADRGQVQQVLMNLCLNARDAMPGGGALRLETANARRGGATPGPYARLRVRDTGVGMDAATVARIFEPFFTTKEVGQGTGLGLATVYGIVQQHGGSVEVASEPGRGTTFDVYLPRAGSTEVRAAAAAPARPRRGTETVLLADDEPMVRNLARIILEGYGYRVLLAGDGREAVDLYARERPGIDLVVLDLTMPQLSGTDAARELLRLNPGVRVLLSSGYAGGHPSAATVAGVCGFVAKPYRPVDLAAAVRAALDESDVRHRDKEAQSE